MAKNNGTRMRPDVGSFVGLLVAFGGILGGLVLEGGSIGDITQITGGIIVLGGTLGAVMITSPMSSLIGAFRSLRLVFFEPVHEPRKIIEEVLSLASRARKNGIVSLEGEADQLTEPFFRKALSLAIDGTDVQDMQQMMHLEMDAAERTGKAEAKVFEAAGGYSPTIGILGAVLGLIQVMKHLDQMEMVGHGIAVAFVATVYGVAAANLFFLPAAAKLRSRVEQASRMKELMLDGVTSILQGLHPTLIERRLEPYAVDRREAKGKTPSRVARKEAA